MIVFELLLYLELSKLAYNEIKITSPKIFEKFTWSCMHDYTCIFLIATMYIHLLQIIKHTLLEISVSNFHYMSLKLFSVTYIQFKILAS